MNITPVDPRDTATRATSTDDAPRRTLGFRGPSRRTLGKNSPSRRTLGLRGPSRRTLGRYTGSFRFPA